MVKLTLRMAVLCLCVVLLLSSCDLPSLYYPTDTGGSQTNAGTPSGDENENEGTVTPLPEETTPEDVVTPPSEDSPEETEPEGPVLSHTFTLSGPYDVKSGYISGTASPVANIHLSEVFDLTAMAEAGYLCRVSISYRAAVQGDHLNLRFSLAMGGSFVLVDEYRYLNNNETATQNHAAYSINSSTYAASEYLSLYWDCKGVTSLDGINYCKVTDVTVQVEFYTDGVDPSEPMDELILNHTFEVPGEFTVRSGYISGTTTPSTSVDLSEVFALDTLSALGYTCHISVFYMAEVQGDHLNLRCTLDGTTVSVGDYVYLANNEKSNMGHLASDISPSAYATFTTLYIKWECKGVSAFDGLNECKLSNVRVEVVFELN